KTARLNLLYGTAHFDNEISRRGKDHAVKKTHLFHCTRFCRGCSGGWCGAESSAVSPACVQIKGAEIIKPTPDHHFTAAPDCRVTGSALRWLERCSRHPVIRTPIVAATGVELFLHVSPAPNDHVTAGPHCCVTKPGSRRVGRAGGCPIVCAWIVFSAGIEIIT